MGKSSGSFNMQIWSQLSKAGQVQTKDLLTGFTKLRELVSLSNIIAIAGLLPTNLPVTRWYWILLDS